MYDLDDAGAGRWKELTWSSTAACARQDADATGVWPSSIAHSKWCAPCRATFRWATIRRSTTCRRSTRLQGGGANPFVDAENCDLETDIQEAMFRAALDEQK